MKLFPHIKEDINYPGVEVGELVAEDTSAAAEEDWDEAEAGQAEDKVNVCIKRRSCEVSKK